MNSVSLFNDPNLVWHHDPTKYEIDSSNDKIVIGEEEGTGGSYEILNEGRELKLFSPAKKDFWSKTFYTPLLIKSDAPALLCPIPVDLESTVKIDFSFTPKSQFDQAGLLVYLDNNHWMKCGIEFCDGSPRLSVVVCNEFSDWSTQPWTSTSVSLKLHKVNQSDSLVVEAAPLGSNHFQFVRIAHLGNKNRLPWRAGPYAASPIAQKGCEVSFSNFSVGPREPSMHSSEL